MATVTYPTGAIRDALERTAADPGLGPDAKRRELRTVRDELVHLAGRADTLLGELSLAEERAALDAEDAQLRLHEDAAIREEMLRRKLATPEQLDELGLPAKDEIAERRADGTLSEALSAADFLPGLHPRDRRGEFIDTPDRLTRKGVFEKGQRVHWERDGETFGGTVAEPADPDGFVSLDVAGVTVAVHADRLRHGPVPAGRDPRLADVRRHFPVGARVSGEAVGEVTGHALAGPALDEPSVKVRNDAGVETYHDPMALGVAKAPAEAPALPESMPPPRPGDPLIAVGLSPLAADGLRSSNEPDSVLDARRSIRSMAEENAGRQVLKYPHDVAELERYSRERWEAWREAPGHDPSGWTPPKGVTYSPEVQKIASPADAQAYLKSRGIDARLTPPDTEQGRHLAADTDWFRQVAQAVTDAQDRYPVLMEGPHPLDVVGLWSDTPQRERGDVSVATSADAVWGTTGYEVADPGINPRMHAVSASQDDEDHNYGADYFAGQKTDIVISDVDQDMLQSREPLEAGLSDATVTPYGRMMHELGHAVWSASGIQDSDLAETGTNPFDTVDSLVGDTLTPEQATQVSDYAAFSVTEGWAEFFATLNVPGALEAVAGRAPGTVVGIQLLREKANAIASERGVPGEKLL